MAKLTVTNNTASKYLVPSPVSKNLNRGETKSFTGISLNAVNQSKAFLTAMLHGSITVVVSEDPNVPNSIETTSASDVDAKIAAHGPPVTTARFSSTGTITACFPPVGASGCQITGPAVHTGVGIWDIPCTASTNTSTRAAFGNSAATGNTWNTSNTSTTNVRFAMLDSTGAPVDGSFTVTIHNLS